MDALSLGWYVQHALLLWLVALAAVVSWRLLNDPRALAGFFVSDPNQAGQHGTAQMDRMQLMAGFAFALGGYILQVARVMGENPGALKAMPEVPDALLTILVGSQAIYVSGKLVRTVRQ